MSGHSKWHSIKFQKGVKDARRGQTFTKLGNNIAVAAKKGGSDPETNFSLRLAVEKARQANMPKDNIERAIKRGTGELGGTQIEELVLEGFGPAKTGLIIEAVTDNKNRTLSDVRNIFTKLGYQLASSGAVSYQFNQQGVIRLSKEKYNLEDLEDMIVESSASDYQEEETEILIISDLTNLAKVKNYLEDQGLKIASAKIEYLPVTKVELSEEEEDKLVKLMSALDDLDDVTEIYSNA